MNLTPAIAEKIIRDRYSRARFGNERAVDVALAEVLQRHGWGALTEEALRDLILTLGDNHRAMQRMNAKNRAHYAAMRAACAAE